MMFLFPFVLRCAVKDCFHEVLAFFGELPSPAWAFPGADAVSVDAVDVSCPFQFDRAASQALGRVPVSEVFRYSRQLFLCDWFFDGVEDYYHVELWGAVH